MLCAFREKLWKMQEANIQNLNNVKSINRAKTFFYFFSLLKTNIWLLRERIWVYFHVFFTFSFLFNSKLYSWGISCKFLLKLKLSNNKHTQLVTLIYSEKDFSSWITRIIKYEPYAFGNVIIGHKAAANKSKNVYFHILRICSTCPLIFTVKTCHK